MESWQNTLRILGDDRRRQIVWLLLEHDLCVGALSRKLEISEAAASQHLRILRQAGLVLGEKRGYFTHYRVQQDRLREAGEHLIEAASHIRSNRDACRHDPKGPCCHERKEGTK